MISKVFINGGDEELFGFDTSEIDINLEPNESR